MTRPAHQRLSQDQRDEITRRVLAGEKAGALGEEFGVTRAYVGLLKAQVLDPERFMRQAEAKLTRKLTAAEKATFIETLASSTPEDHDLVPTSARWSLAHGHQLAWKLFHKHVGVRVVTECVTPYMPKRGDFRFTRPQPPKPHHINQISTDLAQDPDYVAYYLSPICEQIERREYELAVADWDVRFAPAEERELELAKVGITKPPAAPPEQVSHPAGQRTGKHAHRKGRPFTPPKRRKKHR